MQKIVLIPAVLVAILNAALVGVAVMDPEHLSWGMVVVDAIATVYAIAYIRLVLLARESEQENETDHVHCEDCGQMMYWSDDECPLCGPTTLPPRKKV